MADIFGTAQAELLFGTAGGDTISGEGSSDRLYGGAGGDVIDGGDGDDTVYGESGDDVIDGGAGNDFVRDGAGNDIVRGGEGDDRVVSDVGSDQFHGEGGNDTFDIYRQQGGNTVSVTGGLGNDNLNLRSFAAGNTLTADLGEGQDEFYFTSARGSATVTLGAGRDIFYGSSDFGALVSSGAQIRITDWEGGAEGDFLNVADVVRFTSWNGSANPFTAGYLKLVQSGSDVVLSYSSTANGVFANVVVFQNTNLAAFSSENFGGWSHDGSVAADRHVVGTGAATQLLTGGSGNDLIEGGAGRDRVYGGAGNDQIQGGGGIDRLAGGAGDDVIQGGDGDDLILGDTGNDVLHGGEGDDYIEDGGGHGSVFGEAGNDEIWIQRSFGTAAATVFASGGDGHDLIAINVYNASQATVDAGDGDDRVTLNGNAVSQTVTLGGGADVVTYTVNNYSVLNSAQAGVTRINDFQTGDSGDRLKIASPYSILGSDPYASGFLRLVQNGADVQLQYDVDGPNSGSSWITLITLVNVSVGAFTPYNLGVASFGGVSATGLVLSGTAGDDRIHGNYAADVIGGGDGNDILDGLGGDDELSGGLGSDVLTGESGADHLLGDDGDDDLSGGDGNDLLEGGEGADIFSLGDGDDVALGGGGNDSIDVVDTGNDTAHGGDGDDYLYVSRFSGTDQILLTGGAGSDRIYIAISGGGSVQVEVDAGTGDDRVVVAGGTANRITLGAGRDLLEFGIGFTPASSAVVTDFQAGEGGDMLDFDAWLYGFAQTIDPNANPFLTGTMQLVQSGADLLVQFDRDGAGGSNYGWVTLITLQNVDIAAVRPVNFDNYQLLFQHGTEAADTMDGGGFDDRLYGEGGDDTIRGFAGADSLYGGEGNDSIQGGDGADKIQGDAGDDVLEGGAGIDTITGGEGSDRIDGGTERDLLEGNDGNDIIAGGDGNDDVFGDAGDDSLTGGAGVDALIGGLGSDSMDGGGGDDLLYSVYFDPAPQHDTAVGGAGFDVLQVDFFDIPSAPGVTMTIAADAAGGYSGTISAGADYSVAFSTVEIFGISGTDQADQITTGDGSDLLVGQLGDDVLTGGGGADWLIGGGGADTMIGGAGNDRYDLDNAADVMVENEGGGTSDRVDSWLAAYTLLPNFEILVGMLTTGQTLTGNGLANGITGGSGNDILDGAGGDDLLQGGLGNDIYYVDAADSISDSGGIDEVRTTHAVHSIALSSSLEHLTGLLDTGQTLTGNNVANTIRGGGGNDQLNGGGAFDSLYGGAGNDVLDGGTGGDTMRGEQGDDVYVVDGSSDSVVEAAGEGVDKVTTAYFAHSLSANVENLTGLGNVNQTLNGNHLDNVIDGGLGADSMTGSLGNDTYVVDNAGDTVTEVANEGTDEIRTGLSTYSLSALPNVENLTGTSAAGQTLTGNGSANVVTGAGGNDVIDGGAGVDTLRGGGGNDRYFVDAGDVVVENSGEGTDEIRTGLATYVLGANVENLTATSDVNHDFRGNSGNNVVTGGAGNDTLRLYDGGDDTVLAGAGGDNIFMIGSLNGADVVNGGDGVDTMILQGDYAGGLTLSANVTQIENISILGGGNTNFGDPGTNQYDYSITLNDANFAAGVQARINGSALLADEDFVFDGSAETDAKLVVYGGRGKDTLTGGQSFDIFFFAEGRFATGDTVNGGAGYDGMFLRGNYTIDFNAPGYTGLFTNIENLTLTSATDERYARGGGTEFDYNLVLSDAIVKPGETLTVSGTILMASETMALDASQETDGMLRLFGGKAADTLKGGALADLIHGNLGADVLAGNGGADSFRYQDVAESNSGSMDHILDFTAGTDQLDLSRIDANTAAAGDQGFSWIGSNAFSGTAGELRAYQSGSDWFVEGDVDGDSVADLVISLTLQGATPLSAADFLL